MPSVTLCFHEPRYCMSYMLGNGSLNANYNKMLCHQFPFLPPFLTLFFSFCRASCWIGPKVSMPLTVRVVMWSHCYVMPSSVKMYTQFVHFYLSYIIETRSVTPDTFDVRIDDMNRVFLSPLYRYKSCVSGIEGLWAFQADYLFSSSEQKLDGNLHYTKGTLKS